MISTLKIFIAQHCPGCAEALDIAHQIQQNYAHIFTVEVIDLSDEQATVPEGVFATPTYMIGERVVSLGNPSQEQIKAWAAATEIDTKPAEVSHDRGC